MQLTRGQSETKFCDRADCS